MSNVYRNNDSQNAIQKRGAHALEMCEWSTGVLFITVEHKRVEL